MVGRSRIPAGNFDRRVRIERPVASTAFKGAGSGTWELVAEVLAEVRDAFPSRGEQAAGGFPSLTRPARVRIRFRTDITASMRMVMGGRIMQIVAGPAEIGRREALEFVVAEYSPAGNQA